MTLLFGEVINKNCFRQIYSIFRYDASLSEPMTCGAPSRLLNLSIGLQLEALQISGKHGATVIEGRGYIYRFS